MGKKFYVVWKGLNPGVYSRWEDCRLQVEGQADAKYKSFTTNEEAREAFDAGYASYLRPAKRKLAPNDKKEPTAASEKVPGPVWNSLTVDAACSGNPGLMEYRGVIAGTGQEIFHVGPLKQGTNNIGEFLAIVHGLALIKQQGSSLPIYSDSVNAIKWVKAGKCKTQLVQTALNAPIFDLISR
ncbi:MAG: ribonuclease H family protein, partial [Tannerella sp.]|nr:ribonuclease H family protein [Tannerella sp.]